MTAYYVATLARYVVVEAKNEAEAKQLGNAALRELYADVWWSPDAIRMVRPATTDEIDMVRTHERMLADEMPAQPGDRIRLVSMRDDPDPIAPGQLGTIVACRRNRSGADIWFQIDVAWDNGRTLMLVWPPDRFVFVLEADAPERS